VVVGCAIFFVGSVGSNLWFWLGPRAWQARLTCPQRVFDFGARKSGETVEHSFQLQNTGRRDLEFGGVLSSCGCLTAGLPQDRLAPGEEMTVPVRISLRNLRGRVLKTILIRSNDPRQSSLLLTVTGSVQSPFSVAPERVEFGDVASGKSATREVRINAPAGATIRSVGTTVRGVTAGLRPAAPGEPAIIDVRITEEAVPGRLAGRVVVDTTDETEPQFWIPVVGRVTGD